MCIGDPEQAAWAAWWVDANQHSICGAAASHCAQIANPSTQRTCGVLRHHSSTSLALFAVTASSSASTTGLWPNAGSGRLPSMEEAERKSSGSSLAADPCALCWRLRTSVDMVEIYARFAWVVFVS